MMITDLHIATLPIDKWLSFIPEAYRRWVVIGVIALVAWVVLKRIWYSLSRWLRRRGEPVGDLDLQIAGVAVSRGLTLVTNNTRHFDRVPDLQLENWLAGSGAA